MEAGFFAAQSASRRSRSSSRCSDGCGLVRPLCGLAGPPLAGTQERLDSRSRPQLKELASHARRKQPAIIARRLLRVGSIFPARSESKRRHNSNRQNLSVAPCRAYRNTAAVRRANARICRGDITRSRNPRYSSWFAGFSLKSGRRHHQGARCRPKGS